LISLTKPLMIFDEEREEVDRLPPNESL